MVALLGPKPSPAFVVLTLWILAGGSQLIRDLLMLLLYRHVPQGVSCFHRSCL